MKGRCGMETEYCKKEIPKILIVDDISINVELMKNIIEHEGYETLCALSVQEAIGIMKETLPTLVLSDLSMPEVNGLEFCRMLKSNPRTRDIPFIFISVLNTSEEKEQAFLAGAVDYIPKPFEPVEVIMRVNNQLNSYRMKLEMARYNRMMHKLVEDQKRQIEREQENVLLALEKVMKKRSAEMGSHLEKVSHNCKLLAQSLQFLPEYENEVTDEFVETIEVAAKLHDIGGLVMADSVCLRDGRLKVGSTDEQNMEYIRKHTEEGAEILEEICAEESSGRFLTMAIKIARYHHANWDGTGYPDIKGQDIPLEARIAALANDFDALAGTYSMEESIHLINEKSGIIYEPNIVMVFNKVWRQMQTESR